MAVLQIGFYFQEAESCFVIVGSSGNHCFKCILADENCIFMCNGVKQRPVCPLLNFIVDGLWSISDSDFLLHH